MTRRNIVFVGLVVAVLAVISAPVEADGLNVGEDPPCIKFTTDPPSAVVDVECIIGDPTFPPEP